ncbi:MAG: hypothetical protein ABSB89_02480 [Candidatus Bathyarchaeia archaeon]|jgi:hypothetical protein
MLGFYTNFPQNIHKAETFSTSILNKKLQQTLVEALYRLNSETPGLEEVAEPSVPCCKVIFEFGVAEDNDFNYLDEEERKRLLAALQKKPFQVLDFFCVIRYRRMIGEKKARMRFDYYMLRFMFGESLLEVHVSHEKGTRHISPDDLVNLLVNRVNGAFSKKVLKPTEAD